MFQLCGWQLRTLFRRTSLTYNAGHLGAPSAAAELNLIVSYIFDLLVA